MNPQVVQPGSAVAYVNQQHVVPDALSEAPYKHGAVFRGLGISQMILGIISAILGITLAVYANIYELYYYNGHYDDYIGRIAVGVWCGVFFFTSGLLGVISAKKKTRCLVVAALTMSIFSSLAALVLFGFEITGALIATDPYNLPRTHWNVSAGIHSTLVALAFIELVLSIIHAAYCCNCKCDQQPRTYCIASSQTVPVASHGGYDNTNVFPQGPNGQPPITYIQTSSQPGTQMLQQPTVLTTGVLNQTPAYQVQQLHVPQAILVQQQQQQPLPQQQQAQRQEKEAPPTYQSREQS